MTIKRANLYRNITSNEEASAYIRQKTCKFSRQIYMKGEILSDISATNVQIPAEALQYTENMNTKIYEKCCNRFSKNNVGPRTFILPAASKREPKNHSF